MPDVRKQAITGVVPPEVNEARIREAWPSVQRFKGPATVGRILTRTIVLAPLAWFLMAPLYFGRVLAIATWLLILALLPLVIVVVVGLTTDWIIALGVLVVLLAAPAVALLLGINLFPAKLEPFAFGVVRYTLTNRRVMTQHGFLPRPAHEVPLSEIEEVRVKTDANSDFFRAAELEIVSNGQVVLTLRGVPEPEGFRQAILNACNAWVPQRKRGPFIPASAAK
jgi:membrane protein YdbS with pleckstrin-like domain